MQVPDFLPVTLMEDDAGSRKRIGCLNPSGSLSYWTSDMTYNYYLRFIRGAVKAAWRNRVSLLLISGGTKKYREKLSRISVDGLIILGDWINRRVLDDVRAAGIPFAVIGCTAPEDVSSVSQDHRMGGFLAAEHLVHAGHRRIAYIGQADDPASNAGRFQGYREALESNGIPFDPALTVSAPFAEGGGGTAMKKLLSRSRDFTAAVCFSDNIFFESLGVLKEQGIAVPRDLAVVGYDDSDRSRYAVPSLSSVHVPLELMGERAVTMLLGAVNGMVQMPFREVLPVRLIKRESSSNKRMMQI